MDVLQIAYPLPMGTDVPLPLGMVWEEVVFLLRKVLNIWVWKCVFWCILRPSGKHTIDEKF